MSGSTIHIKTDDGAEYDMPEDVAMQAMQDFDKHGVKFTADDAPQPKKQPSQGGVFVEPPPQSEPKSIWEQLLSTMGDQEERKLQNDAIDTNAKANMAPGLVNGATLGTVDLDHSDVPEGEYNRSKAVGSLLAPTLGSSESYLGNAALQAGTAGLQAGVRHYAEDPEHNVLDALVSAYEPAKHAGETALVLGGVGRALGATGDRARMSAFNTDSTDLRELNMTPSEFNQMTSEAGANNVLLPMSREAKQVRMLDKMDEAGQQQAAAIAAADAKGLGNQPFGRRIADDVFTARDPAWHSGAPNRENIVNRMTKTAEAAQDAPLDSLAKLRQYKTNRAEEAYANAMGDLETTAQGQASRAAADSAKQQLDGQMAQSGAENFRKFTDANKKFSNAAVLEELLSRRNTPPGILGDVGAGVAGAAMSGGNPMAAAASMGARRMVGPIAADAIANVSGLGSSAANGASQLAGSGVTATEQLMQVQGAARGQLQPRVVESLLDQQSPMLGPYAQELSEARQNGTLNQKLSQLRATDPFWKSNILPQLQQATAQGQ